MRAIVAAYINRVPGVRTICLDEFGPLAVKTYPGAESKLGPHRATFGPDYGRRGVAWVHSAFEPASGRATFILSDQREAACHIRLMEQVLTVSPADRWLLMEDNLSTHHSRDVQTALLAWPEIQIQFLPKYASRLNLVEPWWKQLRSLALKGHRFETAAEMHQSLYAALDYWNAHKRSYHWRTRPQEQPA